MYPTRRQFLHATAAGLMAGPLFAQDSTPEKPAAPLSFSFSLYGMRSLALPKALAACAEIGYDSVELVANAGWPCDPETLTADDRAALRGQLADLNLSIAGIMENLPLLVDEVQHKVHLDRLKRAFELAHALQPDNPPVVETILGGQPAQWPQVQQAMADRLQSWAEVAAEAKGVIAIKPHVGGAVHTPIGAASLLEKVNHPAIRLAFDYSHFELRGFSLDEAFDPLIKQAVFIHIKDTTGTAAKFQFLLPGEGRTDYTAYCEQLKQHRSRAPIVVEVSGQIHTRPDYDPIVAARRSYAPFATALKEAGLRP